MPADSVFVAYVHENKPTGSFQQSFLNLVGHDLANSRRFVKNGYLAMVSGTDGVAGARNKVVRDFLKSGADWLFWLDDDMGFAPDTVDRLAEVADPVERPIVGALCFAMRSIGVDGMNGWRTAPIPVIYDWGRTDEGQGFTPRRHYPRNTVVQCSATGSACVLIHRSVFVKIGEEYLEQGQAWYDRAKLQPETWDDGAVIMAEDLSFCMRAAAVGCPTFVHTGVRTTHEKPVWLGEDRYLAESWPEPAREPVAVIVPVLSRPQNVGPFMRSLRASTGLATAYFVCDIDDTVEQDAVEAHGGVVLTLPDGMHGTFAVKANYGYQHTSEPWLVLVGDDVMFRPGWYDRAIRAAGDRFHLVALEDLSAIDRLDRHAVHPLIRRVWVDEHGASWDGPGTVAHEGYRHNFVDNEWSAVARQAGVFVSAPDAVVEHLHPLFKKAEVDAVYRKGAVSYDRDKRLWEKRAKAHARDGQPSGFSVAASVAAYDRQWRTIPGLVKVQEDLDRYSHIIEATRPEVLVECGTWTGRSADWFAAHGLDVITIDTDLRPAAAALEFDAGITFLHGSSTDPEIVAKVTELVAGRRCMVVLDSDHSATHVAAEMECYAPLVSPGCYMVVEDGICRWVPGTPVTEFGPLDAIEAFLPRPGWSHDDDVLNLHPVSHHPGGWLRAG